MSRIIINPGHYPGLDPGAIGPTGLQEADIAKTVAAKLETILDAGGHEVHVAQENDLSEIVSRISGFLEKVIKKGVTNPPIFVLLYEKNIYSDMNRYQLQPATEPVVVFK